MRDGVLLRAGILTRPTRRRGAGVNVAMSYALAFAERAAHALHPKDTTTMPTRPIRRVVTGQRRAGQLARAVRQRGAERQPQRVVRAPA